MPRYLSNTIRYSVIVGLIAAFIHVIAKKPQPQISLSDDKTYCYTNVQTLSEISPIAECFSVTASGKFSRVFSKRNNYIHNGQIIESKGVVVPGLWDSHGHVLGLGETLQTVQLYNSKSMQETIFRVKSYAIAHLGTGTKDNWILGTGWDQAAFGRMPASADLDHDDALKNMYIMLYRVDGHCIWVSTAVLQLLPSQLPPVPGGDIIGEGVFCDNAMDLVMKHASKPDKAKLASYLKSAMKMLNSVGLVGVHEAGVTPIRLRLYEELVDTDDWTVRIYAMLECAERNTFCPKDARKIDRGDGRLIVKSVKLFADGALGSFGSALLEPYEDRPQSTGSLLINGSTIKELTSLWAQAGYQVNIHGIGDRANRYIVDAFETAYLKLCPDLPAYDCQMKHRFRIEHAQIVHPNDQARMFNMGIIPSIQPTHATSDMSYAESRLGPERTAKEAYQMRSFLPLNPILGSDFPVEPANPLHGIYAAVTRRSPRTGKGKDGADEGWHMEEALNLTSALKGFTTAPAWGAFLENKAGVIQEGAWADWVVLDSETPFDDMSDDELLTTKVKETWIGGKLVYKRHD